LRYSAETSGDMSRKRILFVGEDPALWEQLQEKLL
jgi:hypothetical protein